jgi:uncharacterized spore protein YtfJ
MARNRSRSRSRERRRSRSRSRDGKRHRSRSRSRDGHARDRDRRRDRSHSRERQYVDRRHHHHRRSRSRSRDRSRREEEGPRTKEPTRDQKVDVEKQAARSAKLQAWKQQKQQEQQLPSAAAPVAQQEPETAVQLALRRAQEAAAALANKPKEELLLETKVEGHLEQEEEIDPLDAFMAAEVLPEVKAKEAEEKRMVQEETEKLKELFKSGKVPKALQDLIADEDEEEKPDEVLEIPANKLKLVIGPGGEKIKEIERKSKCRIQHAKDSTEMSRGFGLGYAAIAKAAVAAAVSGEKKMITLQLFGNADACEMAREMITEAVENREQKAKQKEKEYEKKKAAKSAQRQIYHLRHTRDYEALELPLGASKADVKAAFRKLALKWHPDKNKGRLHVFLIHGSSRSRK